MRCNAGTGNALAYGHSSIDGFGRHRWDVWLNWMRRQESYEELKLLEAQWCMAAVDPASDARVRSPMFIVS